MILLVDKFLELIPKKDEIQENYAIFAFCNAGGEYGSQIMGSVG